MGTDMNIPENLIKFNVNQTGFYRVNYPDNIWQRFASRLETVGPSAVRIGTIITASGIIFSSHMNLPAKQKYAIDVAKRNVYNIQNHFCLTFAIMYDVQKYCNCIKFQPV